MRFCTGVFYLDKPKNNANIFLLKVWYVIIKKYAKICNLQMEETSMNKATLVIMAAGIGSRFGGGIKQLEPVGPKGEIIMDYSIYDAMEAGFDKIVFVIRKDIEEDFRRIIGNRIEKKIKVEYVFQEVDDIPDEYKEKFKGRTKPWGTGQAILCCKEVVKEPFLVINADDYYGKEAYVEAFNELTKNEEKTDKMNVSMVSFVLKNTLSENGGVTRGVCKVDENQLLTEIVETSNIIKTATGAAIKNGENEKVIDEPIEVDGQVYHMTGVSMGNPHTVIYVDDVKNLDLEKIGPKFENHERFPKRINTEFVHCIDRNTVEMRVWERGSGETLACGTGACAVAVASILNNLTDTRVTVKLLGGDLQIEWDREKNHVFMTGPAKVVFDGVIDITEIKE